MLDPSLFLSFKLAVVTTVLLLLLATPVAWWLAFTRHPIKPVIETLSALPLVLPPTVMGFYLLLLMSPNSLLGGWWLTLTDSTLTFSFSGLVIASLVYSLPFAVQPLQTAFEQIGKAPLEAAATLRASPLDTFWSVAVPMARRGFITAAALPKLRRRYGHQGMPSSHPCSVLDLTADGRTPQSPRSCEHKRRRGALCQESQLTPRNKLQWAAPTACPPA